MWMSGDLLFQLIDRWSEKTLLFTIGSILVLLFFGQSNNIYSLNIYALALCFFLFHTSDISHLFGHLSACLALTVSSHCELSMYIEWAREINMASNLNSWQSTVINQSEIAYLWHYEWKLNARRIAWMWNTEEKKKKYFTKHTQTHTQEMRWWRMARRLTFPIYSLSLSFLFPLVNMRKTQLEKCRKKRVYTYVWFYVQKQQMYTCSSESFINFSHFSKLNEGNNDDKYEY